MLGRIRDALMLLAFGRLPVELRLIRLEFELRELIMHVANQVELLNAAQARAVKAITRRAAKESKQTNASESPPVPNGNTGVTPTGVVGSRQERQRRKWALSREHLLTEEDE